MKRVKILYEGRVQGVGFRYTCMALAQELGLTGYVKNLEDGDVELVLRSSDQSFPHETACGESLDAHRS